MTDDADDFGGCVKGRPSRASPIDGRVSLQELTPGKGITKLFSAITGADMPCSECVLESIGVGDDDDLLTDFDLVGVAKRCGLQVYWRALQL